MAYQVSCWKYEGSCQDDAVQEMTIRIKKVAEVDAVVWANKELYDLMILERTGKPPARLKKGMEVRVLYQKDDQRPQRGGAR